MILRGRNIGINIKQECLKNSVLRLRYLTYQSISAYNGIRMTKTARVICIIFITSTFLVSTSQVYAGFEELLSPVAEIETANINPQIYHEAPSITFGDLLNNNSISAVDNPIVATDEAQIRAKNDQFKKLLAQLEENYQLSLTEFKAQEALLPRDLPYDMAHPSPTPYIPIPTLIAGISELTTNNQEPITTFPTPTLTDHLLLASLNSQLAPTPQSTNNNTGTLTQNPVKTNYTIALLGDSMTDVLGKNLPHLRSLLQNAYPNYTFALLNYGQGATDLESGLHRLTNTTTYLGTDYPPLLSYKPDILVVESFAYNHWSGEKYDLDRQWLDIAKIIDTVRQNSPNTKIVLAASIAPNKDIFGDGVLNWPGFLKEQATLIIKAYLQNMVNFATSQHYPLADAYHPSLESDGQGVAGYISGYDHLHPSGDGGYLYSSKIVEAIKSNSLIN